MAEPARPPSDALLAAARRLMRPLVRLAMQAGISFPVFADMLRQLFVDVALTELLTDRRARTDSRVSLITGVHRKEIRRLRLLPADTDPIPQAVTIGSQIIALWLSTPAYMTPDGGPRVLPRAARGEGEVSFDSLVASVTSDVRPRAVLDDWRTQGIVTVDETDHVRLNVAAFIPRAGGREQLFYFGRNLHDHIAAAAANVAATGPAPFIDRSVHYDRLSADQSHTLEQTAREIAQRALLDVNRAAMALVESEPGNEPSGEPAGETSSAKQARVNFGLFVYRDDGASEGSEPP